MIEKQKISKTFLGFLAASLLVWFLINLSKTYTSNIDYKVDYSNLPNDKILTKEPAKTISLKLKASGFKLFTSSYKNKKITLSLNELIQKNDSIYFLLLKNKYGKINNQLPNNLKLQVINTDTVFFSLATLGVKKVPIIPDLNIKYKTGYSASSKIKITPDSIELAGPKNKVFAIKNIKTAKLEMFDVSSNFSKQVKLILPNEGSNWKFNANKVTVVGSVDKFTEGELSVPLMVKNLPTNVKIEMFPKEVKIKYKVGLKNFNKINKESFVVLADYSNSKDNNLTYLIPKVAVKTKEVSSVRLLTTKVEYIILK